MSADDVKLVFALKSKRAITDEAKQALGHPEDAGLAKTIPKSSDVEALETKRSVNNAEDNLKKTKKSFAEKIEKLKKRALVVAKEQERLRKNLIKYNNFVREKQLKVEEGNRTFEEERAFQESIHERISSKEQQLEFLQKAKDLMEASVNKRVVFREYLQTVVVAEGKARNRYKDIGELMKRCETLVVTRDEAKKTLQKLQDEILGQEKSLAAFKEAQNERILSLSSKQNELQDALYQIQAQRDSKNRLIEQEDEVERGKKLSIANIKLSILTLWQYVNSKKVFLPKDPLPHGTSRPPDDLEKQLEAVMAHVEDLEAVIARVRKSENAAGYLSPLVSHSELRIDY